VHSEFTVFGVVSDRLVPGAGLDAKCCQKGTRNGSLSFWRATFVEPLVQRITTSGANLGH
jgi:hypothetical protein